MKRLQLQKTPISIPHNRLTFDESDVDAVAEAVRSGHWACGPRVMRLERRLADRAGCAYAVIVDSGLSALRLALHGLGVGRGDAVIVPAYCCVAIPNAVAACGGRFVPVDVTPGTWVIDYDEVSKCVATIRPKAIVAVHTFGSPAPVMRLRELDIPVIEDCSHGFGRTLAGAQLGSQGDAAILSFYATKLIGSGEGGAVLTSLESLGKSVYDYRDYTDLPPDGFRLNNKMSDVEAALAGCQLDRLDSMIDQRRRLALRYHSLLHEFAQKPAAFTLPNVRADRVWYRFTVELASSPAKDMVRELEKRGIQAAEPVFDWRVPGTTTCPTSDDAYRNVLSLPLYPTLTTGEQDRVVDAFLKCLYQ